MAEISKITLPNGSVYDLKDTTARSIGKVSGVKGNNQSTYRTGNVNVTAENVGAFEKKSYDRGTLEAGIRPLIDQARANRLIFLPADQIIIEKTTNGGTTWEDAEISDSEKRNLFVNGQNILIPLLNNAKSTQCGIRITITGMKYNIPTETAETNKYNYWNSTYVNKQQRYFNVREWWFWISSNNDSIKPEIYCATGAQPNNWVTVFNKDFGMNGWSGSDWIRAGEGKTFGGSPTQATNYWNWRLIFWSKFADNKTEFLSNTAQYIQKIKCYGDSVWGMPYKLGQIDHIYSYDSSQNTTFPANITATSFNGNATSATTATKDGDGNIITSHYVTLSTNQTILGQKTFTNTVTIGNSISNNDSKIVVNDSNINMTDQNNNECFFLGFSETTGNYYHNEGVNNQISGNYSYTYGQGLISDNDYQMVIGKYNQTRQSENYVFVIGNGTSENDRASIFSIGDRGQIRIHNSDITINDTPSSTYNSYAIRLGDSNGDRIGEISYYYGTDGSRGISIQGYRKVSDVDYFNTLRLSLDANHNPIVAVSSAAAWRSALNLSNVLDLTRVTEFRKANVTINANTSTTVEINYTIPTGFDNGRIITWRVDTADTTSGANASLCVVTNHWLTASTQKISATVRNLASSQAKVTVNIKVLFFRDALS